jgi:hypothetical protein
MKKILLLGLLVSTHSFAAETLYQCAVDHVGSDGARVNVTRNSSGKLRANLIFGTTVSGKMYNVQERSGGYSGEINGQSEFKISLEITKKPAKNSNIEGFESHLDVSFPTALNPSGKGRANVDLVCGKKLPGRWQ